MGDFSQRSTQKDDAKHPPAPLETIIAASAGPTPPQTPLILETSSRATGNIFSNLEVFAPKDIEEAPQLGTGVYNWEDTPSRLSTELESSSAAEIKTVEKPSSPTGNNVSKTVSSAVEDNYEVSIEALEAFEPLETKNSQTTTKHPAPQDPTWPINIGHLPPQQSEDKDFVRPPVWVRTPKSIEDPNENDNQAIGKEIYTVVSPHDTVVLAKHRQKIFEFHVSKHTLALASPVLKVLINEAHGRDILIGEHGARSLAIYAKPAPLHKVLNILHFKAGEEFLDINFKDLKDIANFCEKYKLHKPLLPWFRIWMSKLANHALEPGNEAWLHISKVFGDDTNRPSLISALSVESSTISKCRSYLLRNNTPVKTKNLPWDYLGKSCSPSRL
ncbi:hypothetical protein ABW20_dc0107417 [Dactylellina cionopaga]|nr:hypothetical protein ABW20_dc0107417 [Dactylellina cionopaga]